MTEPRSERDARSLNLNGQGVQGRECMTVLGRVVPPSGQPPLFPTWEVALSCTVGQVWLCFHPQASLITSPLSARLFFKD